MPSAWGLSWGSSWGLSWGTVPVWTPIDDDQNPGWQPFGGNGGWGSGRWGQRAWGVAGAPGWAVVGTTVTTWQTANTANTPGWAPVVDTQLPSWQNVVD